MTKSQAISNKRGVFNKIINLFDKNKIPYTVINHKPVFTSEEAAKIRDVSLSMGAKALVLVADKQPILVVVPGDKKANFRKIKDSLKIKDLRMATIAEVKTLTTLEVGSIPPIGSIMGLKSYFDDSFSKKSQIAFNAGLHTTSIKMRASDLIKAENPMLLSLV